MKLYKLSILFVTASLFLFLSSCYEEKNSTNSKTNNSTVNIPPTENEENYNLSKEVLAQIENYARQKAKLVCEIRKNEKKLDEVNSKEEAIKYKEKIKKTKIEIDALAKEIKVYLDSQEKINAFNNKFYQFIANCK